ncbi:beta-ketoacyl synthase N-terminal-like domain-containing protein [Amycolatopsis sp. YIM 10]|uniref:beta-ketoacyl synthase N-terminal-like domain-containing protein n=1 Tax=Amycolatopsis sp. YIM 10 TaxID=2653857 RepID=UPI0012907398|nr:beta-ketoacyl synthase N-terminal-like domain-containing protein [Amycolatopsis sp. YIM 10]QFU90315.1 3-oxoacyl-[acyl-carrier-protein] synthase 2 [Amycolatopsis sp. YIM 10]
MSAGFPVITGWSVVSPFGQGNDAFADGVRTGRNPSAPPGDEWAVPDPGACLVPDYDPKELVGGKVGRSTDRATVFALATVGRLAGTGAGERTGLVLGTTAGSLRSTMTITRDSLLSRKPHQVDTKVLPAAVMNYAAAQCAIRYGLTGPNTTIAGGPGAGLFALAYAQRLLAAGRAVRVLAGAVEEYSAERAWLNHHNGGGVLGEGGVVFSVESDESDESTVDGLAEVLALHSRVVLDGDEPEALRATASALLTRAGVTPDEIWAAVPATGSEAERTVTAGLFGEHALDRVPGTGVLGDTGAATAAFAVASALCAPGPAGRLVVVLSGDPAGSAAGILLRLKGSS